MVEAIRIQKVLADAGIASRRGADALVGAGRVSVNGRPALVGERVDPTTDEIAVDGQLLGGRSAPVYLALHKPAGVTSTVSDRHAESTVIELLPPEIRARHARIYPVGRLDRESEGLILMTNDGAWAQRLLHPSHEVEREYAIGVARPLGHDQAEVLMGGVDLEEGRARLFGLRPATATETRRLESVAGRSSRELSWYRAVLTQGWKRQLRRMFASVGISVERLVRVRIGSLRLDDLVTGAVRPLTAAERGRLAGPDGAGPAVGPAVRPARGPSPRSGLVVSLDGPASSGKSTVGAGAAQRLGYRFCDTGVLYRALAWLALDQRVDPGDAAGLVALVPRLELRPDDSGWLKDVSVAGQDVTERLGSPAVDAVVSRVSAHADVRAALMPVQRTLARDGRIIMAGRDIGTVILPEADLKLFIEASAAERAKRRAVQRGLPADGPDAARIRTEMEERDRLDSTREVAPLRIPDGATIIRSDGQTAEQTTADVVSVIRDREAAPR